MLGLTRVLAPVRDAAARVQSWAARQRRAPTEAASAETHYAAVQANYAARAEQLIHQHIIGVLPVVGSGDPLSIPDLDMGILQVQLKLDELAAGSAFRRSAGAAFDRTVHHARRQAELQLGIRIPVDKEALALQREEFIARQVRARQRANQAQMDAIRKAIRTYEEGASMREDILHQLWVSRERGKLIARNAVAKLLRDELEQHALEAGCEEGTYHTCRDDKVRKTHAAHDGKRYRIGETPSTLEEVNCRCWMLWDLPQD